jgi:serine/threonine protein kinase
MVDSKGHVKLIDFGFAKKLTNQGQVTYTNCGTLGYAAPEIMTGQTTGYSFHADVWSLGILIVELLSGSLPFEDKSDPLLI